MPKKTGPKPPVEAVVHTRGFLTGVAYGILEGTVEFPIRGEKAFRMERMPNDSKGECAKLVCLQPSSEAVMVLIDDIDEPVHWWGQIPIEGYQFFVRLQKEGKRMGIEFLDCKQPVWCDEAKQVLGMVA